MDLANQESLFPDMRETRNQIMGHHARHFDLVKRVMTFFQNSLERLKIHNRDPQQFIAVGLTLKLLEDVRGSLLLIESGFPSQARSLLRVATEALIILAKLVNSEEFFKAYVLTGERERLKFLTALRTNTLYADQEFQKDITQDLVNQVRATVEGVENKNVEQWARDLNLSVLYDIVYRLYSQDVHTHPRVVEKFMVFRENGEIKAIRTGPWIEDDTSTELVEASKILILAADAIRSLFEVEIQDEIKCYWNEITAIVEQNNQLEDG